MSCITTSQCQQMSTAHVNYCKPPHMTIDDLENGVEWPYTTFFIPSRKGKIIEADKKTISFVIVISLLLEILVTCGIIWKKRTGRNFARLSKCKYVLLFSRQLNRASQTIVILHVPSILNNS